MLLKKRVRVALTVIPIVFAMVLASFFLLKSRTDMIINSLLERNLPSYIVLTHGNTQANLFKGNITFEDVHIEVYNPDGMGGKYADAKMKRFSMDGFSYLRFFIGKKIYASQITMDEPVFLVYPYRKQIATHDSTPQKPHKSRKLRIGTFTLTKGSAFCMQNLPDSLQASALNIEIALSELLVTALDGGTFLPFTYGKHYLSATDIFADLGVFEKFNLACFRYSDKEIRMESLSLQSKYSRSDLSMQLNEEREHVSAIVSSVVLKDIEHGFQDGILFLNVPFSCFTASDMVLYLDKREADRTRYVPMYSEVLRKLPIHICFDTLLITNSRMLIETRVDSRTKLDRLFFDNIEAEIFNISNTYLPGEKTRIHATSMFMDASPTTLDWSFDMNDERDVFVASGSVENYNSRNVNKFHMNDQIISAHGEIERLYFNIRGDSRQSSGDMQMKYNTFTFRVYRNDGIRVKKIFSALGNFWVRDGGRADENGFRHGSISATRDPHKSFFNYLWINVFDGVKHTMTGSGKRK